MLQHDRGTEFLGAVKKLMDKLQVKVTVSSSYHSQSQGKIERSHRSLKKKLLFDMINFRKRGVNWAKQLASYSVDLNGDPKEELGGGIHFKFTMEGEVIA